MHTRPIRRVKLILPALTEATSPFWRPIKYSLFPPLGLATLAAYLDPDLEIVLQDEHVEPLDLDDHPDLVVIQVYITNAYRAYRIADHYRARGAHVALGGLHVTSLPEEAAAHADTIFLGPASTRFRGSCAISRPEHRCAGTNRRRAPWTSCRRSGATSFGGVFIWFPTPSSSREAARTTAPSATRTPSSRAVPRSTRSAWTPRSPKSPAFRGATSISWTTTSSEIRDSPKSCSAACGEWAGSFRARRRWTRSFATTSSKRPRPRGCAACSSDSKRCPATASRAQARARTSAAATGTSCGGSTISAS